MEDYVNHIKQKYMLIIAIAILKTKPAFLSIGNYINILRSKIEDEINFVCSDDFVLDDKEKTTEDTQVLFEMQKDPNNVNSMQTRDIDNEAKDAHDIGDGQGFPSLDNMDNINHNPAKTREMCKQNYDNDAQDYDLTQMSMFGEVNSQSNEDNKKHYNIDNIKNDLAKTTEIYKQNYDNDAQDYDLTQINMFVEINSQNNEVNKSLIENNIRMQVNIENDGKISISKELGSNIVKIYNNNAEKYDNELHKYDDIMQKNNNTQINDDYLLNTQEMKRNLTQFSNDSVDLLQGYDYNNMANSNVTRQSQEVFEILREEDGKVLTQTRDIKTSNNTDQTECESQYDVDMENVLPQTLVNREFANTAAIDSQETELYTVHGSTQKDTCISQSQTQNINISQKYIYGNKNNNFSKTNVNNKSINENAALSKYDVCTQSHYNIENTKDTNNTTRQNSITQKKLNEENKIDCKIEINDTKYYYHPEKVIEPSNNLKNITKLILYSENDIVNKPFKINLGPNVNNKLFINKINLTESDIKINLSPYHQNNIKNEKTNDYLKTTENDFESMFMQSQNVFNDTQNSVTKSEIKVENAVSENNVNITKENQYNKMDVTMKDDCDTSVSTINKSQNVFIKTQRNDSNITTQNDFNTNITAQNDFISSITAQNDFNIANTEQNDTNITTVEMDISEDDTAEVVPFKIMKELNKVKGYLNRRIERRQSRDSTESGYRSDTPGMYYSKNASQPTPCFNQSGHSLFNYLICCPLSPQSMEIINELASVLGQLLDKLHEDENYPSFLEEFLDTVGLLLKSLHQEDEEEDSLLNKEETSQRLLLMNKSFHIQKYTIEQITIILEETHTILTNKETKQEIDNINSIENLCYILHILQKILRKYIKNKTKINQSSQEEKLLRRSSLTDLWRKKWDSNLTVKIVETDVKVCILDKIRVVLNKLIVDCMDGYSLIVYYALECYNLLQTHN